jgi:hypothetical protein
MGMRRAHLRRLRSTICSRGVVEVGDALASVFSPLFESMPHAQGGNKHEDF